MSTKLSGKKVAILVADGFEEVELTQPRQALIAAGAETSIVSPTVGKVKAWATDHWSSEIEVDVPLQGANPDDYDALLLPGGVMNPDKLRIMPEAVEFVKSFVDTGKPIAAICHGPWTLIEAGGVKGRSMTSWPSLESDLTNAGADWQDSEVVVDNGLVTSRKPADISAFNSKMIEEFGEGQHAPEPQLAASSI